jgi:cobalt-zinc-cadmium resistance protein CzcA
MLPAALATGIGSDVQRGVATVVAGGLILATLLTLFVIPTFYFVIERRVERRDTSKPTTGAVARHKQRNSTG